MSYDELEISSRVYYSLQRACGGGIKTNGDKCNCHASFLKHFITPLEKASQPEVGINVHVSRCIQTNAWLEHLKALAVKSVSYPNGFLGNITDGQKMAGDETANIGKPHDVEIRIALSFFHRYKHKCLTKSNMKKNPTNCNKEQKQEEWQHNLDEGSPPLEVISDLGLVRPIRTPFELASLIVRDMEDILWSERTCELAPVKENNYKNSDVELEMYEQVQQRQGLFHHLDGMSLHSIKVDASGIICMVTPERFRFLRGIGRLPCSHPNCIKWLKTEKGLRWHEQTEHSTDYSKATAVASSSMGINELSIVPYLGGSQQRKRQLNDDLIHDMNERPYVQLKLEKKKQDDIYFQTVKDGNLQQFISLLHNDNKDRTSSTTYHAATYLDKNGASALHWAAGCGYLHIVRYLIEQLNVPPDQCQKGKRSFRNRTPLHWSCRNGHLHIVKYLIEEASQSKPRNNDDVDVRVVDFNATTIDGTTAFCWACWQGHFPIMKYLHEQGVDIHKLNSFGCNAVLWAAQSSTTSTTSSTDSLIQISWLESIGMDVSVVNSNGHGVLHKSAQRGNSDVCRWMIEKYLSTRTRQKGKGKMLQQQKQQQNLQVKDRSMEIKSPFMETMQELDWMERLMKLIGPDAENYCPSDVAGMEGFMDLAKYLAEHEKRLALHIYSCYCAYNYKHSYTDNAALNDADDADDNDLHNNSQLTLSKQCQDQYQFPCPQWLRDGLDNIRHNTKDISSLEETFEKGAGIKRICIHIILEEEEERKQGCGAVGGGGGAWALFR